MTVVLTTETDVQKSRPQFNKELLKVVLEKADALGYESSDIRFFDRRDATTRQPRLVATVELYARNTLKLYLANDDSKPYCPAGLDIIAQPLFRLLIDRYHEALKGGAERDQLARELIPHTTINGFRCSGVHEGTLDALPTKRTWGSTRVENFTLKDCAFHLNDTRVVRLNDTSARAIQLEIAESEVTEDINALQQKVYGLSPSSEFAVLTRLRDAVNNALDLLEAASRQSSEDCAIAGRPKHKTRRRKQL